MRARGPQTPPSHVGGRPREQRWRRIAFSILISDTDDHLRNHGFLHTDLDSWRLATAFDLNPNPDPGARHLATAITWNDDDASIDLVLDVAAFFRLPDQKARAILDQVAAAVAGVTPSAPVRWSLPSG